MATTTTTTAAAASGATVDPDRPSSLRADSIPTIDLRLLSQSELYSLSTCSNSSFDLSRCDDVVIPKIDRSVFNESAGSRKQTYSRLRLAPAESSSSFKTTIHRRTPHLRASHAHASSNINDPEQAENSQIICILKQLFKADPKFEDLVTIEVENDSNVVVPELLNTEIKRKRGRPRKHDNAVFIRPPAAKRIRNDTVKKVVVFDNDRDREIVNGRGVKVNMSNLGRLEDPYGPEIRRRTEGMSTQDELLGFLRGLNGQWGTSRKKKRVVDANDFGDALPKGWRLSLSIKKKQGRVWLFCRRYISPSGRQFESCKEVSIYLLSIVGEEYLDKPIHTHSNDSDLKGASGKAADLFVREDLKSSVHNPSAPSTLLNTECEKQITSSVHDPADVQVELFKCLKCFMIFEGKIDLLDHQVLAHKDEKSQLDSAISDWTLVKGGKFECQFCYKTFYERNQYNGHIETHATNDNKTSEASEAPTAEKTVDTVLYTEVPDKKLPSSVSAESNVVTETNDAHFGDKLISASSPSDHKISSGAESKIDVLVHDLNIVAHGNRGGHVNMNGDVVVQESGDEIGKNCNVHDNEVPGTDKAPDVSVSESYICLGHEAPMSIDESNWKFEGSVGTVDCVDDKLACDRDEMVGISKGQEAVSETGVTHVNDKPECILNQGGSSGNSQLSPFSNELIGSAGGVGKDVVGESASVEVLTHAVSETGVQISSICEEKGCGANINDTHICSSFDELTSGKEKFVNVESSSGVFHGRFGVDEDCVAEAKKLSNSGSISLVSLSSDAFSAVNNGSLTSSRKQESLPKVVFAGSTIPASVDQVTHGFVENRLSYKRDEQYEVRSSAFESYNMSSMDGITTVEKEDDFKSCSSVSLWHEKERVSENVGSKVPISTVNEPQTQMNKENFHIENDVKNASSNISKEANLDDLQIFGNNESINGEVASLGSSQNGLNASVTAFNTGKNLEFSSLVSPGNEQAFGFQDDVTSLYDSTHETSERGLLDHFCVAETSDDIFGNKMYSTPIGGLKFDEDRGIGIHELSLAFGNPHALYVDTINVDQKRDDVNCSVVPSKIDNTFDVQTNLSMVNNNMVEDLKAGRKSMNGSFSLFSNNETRDFQHNVNTVYGARTWEDLRSNEHQRNEVVPQSSFHSFDIMSDKAVDGLFRLDERYNDGGFRSGRSEPVEFRFLTGRSEHSSDGLQGDSTSRVFPYNTGMNQDFDSTYWMGKNAMMPNMAGRNLVTSVCAWCRNEFHLQAMAIHPETQAGVGSLCPACSAGISGQVNML